MRDILLSIIVFGVLPLALMRPYVGVMLWSWLSYMNPHRLTYGFAYTFPFAQISAVVLFISLIFSKEKKSFPLDGMMVSWFLLIIWMVITTIFAIHPDAALSKFEMAIKILLMTLVTIVVMRDQRRVDLLVWVICVSIGYYSIKGGIFTLLTGGQHRVYGPADSFITENNALAVATLMIVPLMAYLRTISRQRWVRLGLTGGIFFSLISVVGSQSRGALLAICALGFYFWLQSKHKFRSGVVIVALAAFALAFMPDSWHERMESIANYQEDASAMSRIDAWTFSLNLANSRLTGGGFGTFTTYAYATYYKPVEKAFVAHSIYFDLLAQHGWPGMILWLLILFFTWRNLNLVIAAARDKEVGSSALMLAKMLKLSLVAYLSGGAFLSLSYHDLPWHIFAMAYLLKHQMDPSFNGPVQSGSKVPSTSPSSRISSAFGVPPGQPRPFDSLYSDPLHKDS